MTQERKVKLSVHHGKNMLHVKTLYGTITDAETGELLINATVEYCIEKIQERGYRVVRA